MTKMVNKSKTLNYLKRQLTSTAKITRYKSLRIFLKESMKYSSMETFSMLKRIKYQPILSNCWENLEDYRKSF